MDWAKLIYEVVGPKYPIASQIIVTLLGALIFGGGWWLIGKHSAKSDASHVSANSITLPVASGPKDEIINAPSDALEMLSPDDLKIRVKNGFDGKATNGLILEFINDRPDPIGVSSVALIDAVSFDSRRSRFRTNDQYQRVPIASYTKTPAGDIARQAAFGHTGTWLVRITENHLEPGNGTGGHRVLEWPAGDPATKEVWALTLSVEPNGLPVWNPKLRIEWERGSKTILVSPL